MNQKLYDVVAVNLQARTVRLLATGKTEDNAYRNIANFGFEVQEVHISGTSRSRSNVTSEC